MIGRKRKKAPRLAVGAATAHEASIANHANAMVPTESGLVVPAHVVDEQRERRRWMWDQWKTLRRVIQFFAAEKIEFVLRCAKCQAIITPSPAVKGYDLSCRCRVREVRPR